MINFFDIGAYTGRILSKTIDLLESLGVTYKVYAFEPDPRAFEILYGVHGNNNKISLLKVACSDYRGVGKLYKSQKLGGNSLKATKHNVNPKESVSVQVIKFSDWFKSNIKKDDFNIVKIDIEGSEYEVYEDIVSSGIVNDINVFCGSLGDLYKIGKKPHEIESFLKYLDDNNIIVHVLTSNNIDNLQIIADAIKDRNVPVTVKASSNQKVPEVIEAPEVIEEAPWFDEPKKRKAKQSKEPPQLAQPKKKRGRPPKIV